MMVCPERAYEMFTTSQTSVHSDSAFRKHELAGRMLISSCCPEPGKQNLLASGICFNFYWKLIDLYEDYVLKDSISAESIGQI